MLAPNALGRVLLPIPFLATSRDFRAKYEKRNHVDAITLPHYFRNYLLDKLQSCVSSTHFERRARVRNNERLLLSSLTMMKARRSKRTAQKIGRIIRRN